VYFQDESRFGQQGTTTNVWARRGSRPTAVRQTEYQYLWVLGAVCAETGHAEGLLSPRMNTQIVNLFQDTSLVYVISATDFLGAASKLAQRDGTITTMYVFVAAVYLVICYALSKLAKQLNKKLSAT